MNVPLEGIPINTPQPGAERYDSNQPFFGVANPALFWIKCTQVDVTQVAAHREFYPC